MKEAEMSIPHLFRCPISLDLFTDPVTLCTGQTYDRPSIEKWLAAGNLTCPVTMQKLHDPTFVPNHTLRHLITQWLQLGPHFDPNYLTTIDSLPALKINLESPLGTTQNKLQTLEKILILSKQPPSTSCFLQLGFLPSLLEQLFGKVGSKLSQDYVQFVEKALSCVLSLLPFGQMECLNMLSEESKMESLTVLFEHGTCSMVNKSLCQVVEAISSSPETKQLCCMLGKNHRLLHRIVSLVQQNSEAADPATKALLALCSSESNREYLVRVGAIEGLITYISNAERREKTSLAPIAMARIEQLLGVVSAKEALINHADGVYVVVKMVFRVSDHEGSESAINSLMIICSDSLQAREEAVCGGVLTQLLLLLQSQCSNRTKTKARMLLKLLRSKWVEEQKHV